MSEGPGVGVIGLGFMGALHLGAWQRAADAGWPNRVVAVCDGDPARRSGEVGVGPGGAERARFDPARVARYADAQELLADPAVQVVSITTPTPTHVPLASAALQAGRHVLLEKPVALDPADVQRLARVAEQSGRHCLPAHCMRFWPGWDWLIERVDDGALGPLQALRLQRLASRPDWNEAFYGDASASGGLLHDLHVHDADLLLRLAGPPRAVTARGSDVHLEVTYDYPDLPGSVVAPVVAEGCWDRDPALPFFMGYEATFAGGTASWSSARQAPLLLSRGGRQEALPVAPGSGYDGQVRHLLDLLAGRVTEPRVTLADAAAAATLVTVVARSLAAGREQRL